MTDEEQKAWEELVAEAKRPASMRPYVGHVRVPTETFLAVDAELKALRARVALLEKVAVDFDEAMRGDYHRDGIKIRIVLTQDSLNKFRAALDALKEG